MDSFFAEQLDGARDYTALFRLVKRLVEKELGKSRAGMMLGLAPLGMSHQGFLGGYFVVGSNAIILNRDVLHHVRVHQPDGHNAYAFHVLLHEYLHTLGWLREDEVRPLAHELTMRALGPNHLATRIAAAMLPGERAELPSFFREMVFPKYGWAPTGRPEIEIVKGFDPDATPYIA